VAGTRVLSTKIAIPDRPTAQALRLQEGEFVVEIQRVRLADGSPISLERAQLPADRFPGLLEQQLGGSIYEVLESQYGLVTSRADERIEAVNATSEEATLLGIKKNSALLLITRTAYDQDGAPCEFSHDLFRGDRTRLAVTVNGRGIGVPAADIASVTLQSSIKAS
jgi:GntR family transcriptional regulator